MYGPEGSGKGTQAKLLSEVLHVPILTSGDLVRDAAVNDKGMIGDVCREALIEGKYVADSEMFVMWKRRLKEGDAKNDWIMDGFPRNVDQATFLDDKLSKYGYKVEAVFYLKISEVESLKRLMKRARPFIRGVSSFMIRQEDPNAASDLQRRGNGCVGLLSKAGVLVEMNAELPPEEVHKAIVSQIHHG